MSYPCSVADAKASIASVELSENTRSNTGSKIYSGHSSPGGAASSAKPAGETMSQKRTTLRTATSTLRRKYASTGS
jgi:hypothetical protein